MRKILTLLFVLIILGGGVYWYLMMPKGLDSIPAKYTVKGIDVSEFTGDVDFLMAKNSGVDFVIIRSSFGDKLDSRFESNFKNARLSNIPIGVYHAFNFNDNWKLQCDRFLTAIDSKNAELFYFLNVEDWTIPSFKSTSEKVNDINLFINYFESKSGSKLVLYSNLDGYKKYIKHKFDNKSIWICSFNENFKEPQNWIFWQYSHKGKFAYAQGYVDLNTFNGNANDWRLFLSKNARLK